ncbi:MAG: hypothetical protein Q9160_003773 [Pyrenula sp. 1 TL-2023]
MEDTVAAVETLQQIEPNQFPVKEFPITSISDAISNRGRSSSLSDLETSPVEDPSLSVKQQPQMDTDSEAETEKVDNSPEKIAKLANITVTTMNTVPEDNRLVEATVVAQNDDPAMSDSEISSRSASPTDPMSAGFAESLATSLERQASPKKRKRESDEEEEDRRLRQRTGSLHSSLSEDVEKPDEDQSEEILDQDEDDVEKNDAQGQPTNTRAKKIKVLETKAIKKSKRLNPPETGINEEEDIDSAEALAEASHLSSDEDDLGEAEDDPEAVARSEAEAEKHAAARTSLVELEKQFAVLRDKLYDERISSLQNELAQLKMAKPTHPEFLRQVQCIQAYRDDKKIKEITLWNYKVDCLRRTSAGEVSIKNNILRRNIGDIREHYSEKINESFYKIHKERFKTDPNVENYGVPFPSDRLTQVTHQTAYNKEVSIDAGLAKYKGFPAAPDMPIARVTEMDDDLAKMGIVEPVVTAHRATTRRSNPARNVPSAFTEPSAAAEEQFLENTPWANPRHPANQQPIARPSQQQPPQPALTHGFSTPAAQKQIDISAPNGSASTIAETYSAPTSSNANTPYGMEREKVNGLAAHGPTSIDRNASQKKGPSQGGPLSPSDPSSHTLPVGTYDSAMGSTTSISPTFSRTKAFQSPPRTDTLPRAGIDHIDFKNRQQATRSPMAPLHQQEGSRLQGRVGIR